MKIAVAVVATSLQACVATPLVVTGLGIGGVVVSETTGKTMTDHAVSAANGGQDCRVGRVFKQEDICQAHSTVRLQVITTGVTPSTIQEIQNRYR